MVLETTDEIIERVVTFRQSLVRNQPVQAASGASPAVSIAVGEPPSNG
jgi:hypothetical protein